MLASHKHGHKQLKYVLVKFWWASLLFAKELCWLLTSFIVGDKDISFRWRHNGCDGISNYHPHDCLLNRLFRRRSKKTSKLRVTGLCAGISPGTREFPAQMASNAENVSIWWRHHEVIFILNFQCHCCWWPVARNHSVSAAMLLT